MKYRKKPVVIEAVKFDDTPEITEELERLGMSPVRITYRNPSKPQLLIETLEGTMAADIGDYVIRGVQGEFYPCKPDIFEATYELAEKQEENETLIIWFKDGKTAKFEHVEYFHGGADEISFDYFGVSTQVKRQATFITAGIAGYALQTD